MTSMHVRRSRKARQIEREWEAKAQASGATATLEPHPILVMITLFCTVMGLLFAWSLVSLLVWNQHVTSTATGTDETVGFLVMTGLFGASSPFFWRAVLIDSTATDSAWRYPLRSFAKGLAYIASPEDAAWREEWPGLLARHPGETRRPVRTALVVAGWMWAALRSRAGWMLDACLQSDTVCAAATFGATGAATWGAWEASGVAEAVVTAILTFTGCVAAIDGLCRWRGIELPRKRKGQ
ncbi:hypothetical protein ACFU3O_25725 [Streptomyces antibioticus]|uniref:hypothetical protein n=1 Tax=Streptomyces antibioticus TaxID=1890 RepID=UPI0036A11C69